MEMILTAQDKSFFEKIIRSEKDFKQFTLDYKEHEVTLLECQIYSQNFSIILNELNRKLHDKDFIHRNPKQKDQIIKFYGYFVQAWQLIEKLRMEKSKVKIFINEFIFSEN
jgi:hypothetical protein